MKKLPKCPKCGKSLSYRDHLDLNEAQSKIARYIDDHKNKSDDQTFIENNLKEITQSITDAEDLAKPKFCFLFWCW